MTATASLPNEPSPASIPDLSDVEATLTRWLGGQGAGEPAPSLAEPIRYRRHRCERKHRTTRTFANCCWPWAAWIVGIGPYATVSTCSHGPGRKSMTTVMLHPTVEDARESLSTIDGGGCGGQCSRRHKVIELVIE